MATEALQHMSALQAVLAEAAKLVHSWQQQRIIIALLQQRLKAAAVHMQSGQQRLAAVLQELKEVKDAQVQSSSSAAAATAEYQALLLQFQQVQQQLEQAQAAKGQLSNDSTQLQASLEAALAAAAAANERQQLLEQQLQQLQQQLEQDQAAKAVQQQQLDQTLSELERLRAEHANLQVQLSWYQKGCSTAAAPHSACGCQAGTARP
jgi:chromosome segregation ATPase